MNLHPSIIATPSIIIMGTRGLRIIKFRGRYWVFWNQYDSYLDGMGDSLVKSIPSDPEDYQRWLQSHRSLFAKWDDLLQRTLRISEDQLRNIKSDRTLVGFLGEALKYPAIIRDGPTGTPITHIQSISI